MTILPGKPLLFFVSLLKFSTEQGKYYVLLFSDQLHNLNSYVRDFYFFRRNFYPQLTLVHMNPEEASRGLQRQVGRCKTLCDSFFGGEAEAKGHRVDQSAFINPTQWRSASASTLLFRNFRSRRASVYRRTSSRWWRSERCYSPPESSSTRLRNRYVRYSPCSRVS